MSMSSKVSGFNGYIATRISFSKPISVYVDQIYDIREKFNTRKICYPVLRKSLLVCSFFPIDHTASSTETMQLFSYIIQSSSFSCVLFSMHPVKILKSSPTKYYIKLLFVNRIFRPLNLIHIIYRFFSVFSRLLSNSLQTYDSKFRADTELIETMSQTMTRN
jgi:hypothetical protein